MSAIQLVMLDLDGTLYIGDEPIAGEVEAVTELRRKNFELRFLTNTTTKSQKQLHQQLLTLGFKVHESELISAPVAARLELKNIERERGRELSIWPLVADAIQSDFDEFKKDEMHPDFIVLGDIGDAWDFKLINRIFNLMHQGAELIALHKNRFWQTPDGLMVDIGFFVSGFEYVTGKKALLMGKPNADFFLRVMGSVGASPVNSMMVGDDIESDVGGAQAMGIKGCLVRTGKFRPQYLEQTKVHPDYSIASIADLPQLIASLNP
jgi:HAD superfamily hydrolase (TIGR01458 family)